MLTSSTQIAVLVQALLVYGVASGLRVGLFSLAPTAFAACGGYTVAVLLTKTSTSFGWSLLVAIVGCLVLSVLLAIPLVRLKGIYAALATFAFLLLLQGLVQSFNFTGGPLGILGIPQSEVRGWLVLAIIANLVIWYVVDHTHLGRQLDTIAANPTLAAASGINVGVWRLAAISYSAVLGTVAGAMYARSFYVVTPDVFGFSMAASVASLAIIAGPGHWFAPLVAALTVGVIPYVFTGLNNWAYVLQGVLMVLVIVRYPDGLSGLLRRVIHPARASIGDTPQGFWRKAVAKL